MKVTLVINGSMQLIMEPETEIDKLMLKELNGSTLQMVTDNIQLMGRRLESAGIISTQNTQIKSHENTITENT